MEKSKKKKYKKYERAGLFFILPSLIGVSIFILIPFIDVVIRSFQSPITRSFVFLDNYIEVFNNAAFKLASINTLKFVFVCIPLLLISSLSIAVLMQRFVRNAYIIKTAFLIPMAVPIASIVLIWKICFHQNGILSGFLMNLKIDGVDWMNTGFAFWILVFSYVWKNMGYNIVLWLAGLSCIPTSVYEAAKVDGASDWKCFTNITLPNLKTTLYTVAVLSLLNSFKVFREAYLIGGDYPDKSMYVLQHLFNNWFRDLSFGKMSAGSVVMAFVIYILIFLLQKAWAKEE